MNGSIFAINASSKNKMVIVEMYRHQCSTEIHNESVIVVPCYNESKRIDSESFINYANEFSNIRFLFVDDGSSDGTLSVLARMRTACPDAIDVLALPKNVGKAEAVRQGMLEAIKQGADCVGFFDADLATPLYALNDFARVMARHDDVDIVYGSRRGPLGRRIHRALVRNTVSRICATLACAATGLKISDSQCGAKLFRINTLFRAALHEPFQTGWLFDVELFMRLAGRRQDSKYRFFEFPLMEWTEVEGSSVNLKAIFRSGFIMLKLIAARWNVRRRYRRIADGHRLFEGRIFDPEGELRIHDLQAITHALPNCCENIVLDMRRVFRTGPGAITAVIGLADRISLDGGQLHVILPLDDAILVEAERTGLVATVDCLQPRGIACTTQEPATLEVEVVSLGNAA